MNENQNKNRKNNFNLTSKSIMKLQWEQPLKLIPSWNQNSINRRRVERKGN